MSCVACGLIEVSNSRDSISTLTTFSTPRNRQASNILRSDPLITRETNVYNDLDVERHCNGRESCNLKGRKYCENEGDDSARNFHDDHLLDGGKIS